MSSYEATKPSHDLEESSNTSSDAAANQSDAIGVVGYYVLANPDLTDSPLRLPSMWATTHLLAPSTFPTI